MVDKLEQEFVLMKADLKKVKEEHSREVSPIIFLRFDRGLGKAKIQLRKYGRTN